MATDTRDMVCLLIKDGEVVSLRKAVVSSYTKSGCYITHPTFGTTLILHNHTAASASIHIASKFTTMDNLPACGNIFDYVAPSLGEVN